VSNISFIGDLLGVTVDTDSLADMLVGSGNMFVAEAKRQLYGQVVE
jgi:histidinol dehydrogenase